MIANDAYFELNDGRMACIKTTEVSDAKYVLETIKQCEDETEFIKGGWKSLTVEDEENYVRRKIDSDNEYHFSCIVDNKVVGVCSLVINENKRISHRCKIGIMILKEYWGLGIGTEMIKVMKSFARVNKCAQMELSYVDGNIRGLSLYKKTGFREYGRLSYGIMMSDGSLSDMILMCCLL